MEVRAENREGDCQVLPVDIHLAVQVRLEVPEDLMAENLVMVIRDVLAALNQVDQVGLENFRQDKVLPVDIPVGVPQFPFQVVNRQADPVQERVQVVSHPVVQVHPEDFHQDQVVDILVADLADKGLPVDILVGVPQFPFQVVNRQGGLVQEQVQVVSHPVVQVHPDFHQDKVVDILVADLVDLLDIQAEDQKSQKGLDIPADDRVVDIPADKLLEVISTEHKSLEAREVDILVEDQGLDIQEMVKDLVVVQVLKDQVGIQDQEDQADLKVLEVSKAQHLAEVILVLDQEAFQVRQADIQVDQEHKDQAVIQVVPARKDQVDIQAVHKDRVDIQADQVNKGQEVSQVRKGRADIQVDRVRKDQELDLVQ